MCEIPQLAPYLKESTPPHPQPDNVVDSRVQRFEPAQPLSYWTILENVLSVI